MKILLTALNSKYIHTNLAVRYLHQFSAQRGYDCEIAEYTINQHLPDILDEIYRQHPDVLLLSCYIWNIEMMLDLAEEYRRICPEVTIIAGGPEVSYNSEQLLREHPAFDAVLCGEGEVPFLEYLQFLSGDRTINEVHSLVWKDVSGQIICNPSAGTLDMAQLPFPYPDLEQLSDRILYFESIRGCPFRCSYCLSSVAGKVRYLPLNLCFERLQRFLDAKVRQVKFVDRTFNCSKEHTMAIWRYLAEHDNGITNFHFELTAHLIDQEMIDFLKTVRKGLFQFEIGVQSTNPDTIREIRRTTDTQRLLAICRELDRPKNIHLHLDLIAGLPYEDFDSFGRSFDTVMQIRPQQMQLGFLKVLKGSYMAQAAQEYGLVYSRKAPFQVIRTRWISYDELLALKDMESVVEDYYNSGLFPSQINWMLNQEDSAFSFFLEFGRYRVEQGLHLIPQNLEDRCTTLKNYYFARHPERASQLALLHDLCLFDLCRHTKPKKLPDWVSGEQNLAYREQIRSFYRNEELMQQLFPSCSDIDSKQLSKTSHLQIFSFHPVSHAAGPVALLFDYHDRDLLGAARWTDVSAFVLA